jgi:hypothetical protein
MEAKGKGGGKGKTMGQRVEGMGDGSIALQTAANGNANEEGGRAEREEVKGIIDNGREG